MVFTLQLSQRCTAQQTSNSEVHGNVMSTYRMRDPQTWLTSCSPTYLVCFDKVKSNFYLMQKLKADEIKVMFLPLSAEHTVCPFVASNTPNCKSGCYKNVCMCGTWSHVKRGSCLRVFRNGLLKQHLNPSYGK